MGNLFNNAEHIAGAINKSKKSLHAIKLIAKYMNKNETKQIITSNFYSQLYYNCEIWLLPSLSPVLKQQLLSASTRALKLLNNHSDPRISLDQHHKLQGRATPNEIMRYRLSIQLHKLYNGNHINDDWIDLNFQQKFNNRQKCLNQWWINFEYWEVYSDESTRDSQQPNRIWLAQPKSELFQIKEQKALSFK